MKPCIDIVIAKRNYVLTQVLAVESRPSNSCPLLLLVVPLMVMLPPSLLGGG